MPHMRRGDLETRHFFFPRKGVCCATKCGKRNVEMKTNNMVSTIFYALVVSILSSEFIGTRTELNCFYLIHLSYFLFFTGYFLDESCRNDHVEESENIFDLLSWSFYIIQSATVSYLTISSVFAIIGTLISTVSAYFHMRKISKIDSLCDSKREHLIWIVENILWISGLLIVCLKRTYWSNAFLTSISVLIIAQKFFTRVNEIIKHRKDVK